MVSAVSERNALILNHQGLAKSAALQVARNYRLNADDLCQEAFVALVLAADRFDPSRGTQFSTFAVYVIRGQLKTVVDRERKHSHPSVYAHAEERDSLGRVKHKWTKQPVVELDECPAGMDTTRGELLPGNTPSPEEIQTHAELEAAWRLALKAASARRGRLATALALNRLAGSPRTPQQIAKRFKIDHRAVRSMDAEVMALARSLL